jgi:transposase InsO family protein
LPQPRVEAIERLRRLRMTAAEIAEVLDLPLSTVSLWLKRIGLGKRSRLEPPEPPNRYERRHPGELVHIDIKQLGKISVRGAGHRLLGHRGSQVSRRIDGKLRKLTGFEYLHLIIDDYSRFAYAELLDDLTAACAIAFLRRAVAWYAARGITVRSVMTDNGSCYVAHAYGAALRSLGLKHLRIKPGRAWHTLVSIGPAPVHIDLVGGQMIDTGLEFVFHLRGDGIVLAQAGRLTLAADGSQLDFVGMSVLNSDALCAALAP